MSIGVPPLVSVVIPTYDRPALLSQGITSLLVNNSPHPVFEIIVVDNNWGTIETQTVVESFRSHPVAVRYLCVGEKGSSVARNAGAKLASAPIIAFFDDDEVCCPNWVQTIVEAFDKYPKARFIFGKVRPAQKAPAWLNEEFRGAIAHIDWGDEPLVVSADYWKCLPGGNMAICRETFEKTDGFDPRCLRSQDRELTVQLLLAEYQGMYIPSMSVWHQVELDRMTLQHVLDWWRKEGHYRAIYYFEELHDRGKLRSRPKSWKRIGGVPLFLVRELLVKYWAFRQALRKGDGPEILRLLTRLTYLEAYINSSRGRPLATAPVSVPRQLEVITSAS